MPAHQARHKQCGRVVTHSFRVAPFGACRDETCPGAWHRPRVSRPDVSWCLAPNVAAPRRARALRRSEGAAAGSRREGREDWGDRAKGDPMISCEPTCPRTWRLLVLANETLASGEVR